MGRKKSRVNKSLSRAHLHAIGMVAAQWSNLEMMVLSLISDLSKVPFSLTVSMVAPSNFAAWLDMVRRIVMRSDEHKWKQDKLAKICERLKTRQTERNSVVHAVWWEAEGIGLAKIEKGTGVGMPKRGLKIFIELEKTASEIRGIAKRIEEAERELISWWGLQPPPPALTTLASLLRPAQDLQPKPAKRRKQP